MNQHFLIWDLPVRIFHWLLVMALISLWYTSDQDHGFIEYHIKLGYFTLALVLFRIIWGVVGTQYAQFKSFKPSLSELKEYFAQHKTGNIHHSTGHNAAGSWMVVIMLTLLFAQATSGLFINDDVFSSGPYYGAIGSTSELIMKYLHHNAFDLIIALSVLHIAAVVYYLKVKKVDLIKPMFTGKKPENLIQTKEGINNSKLGVAIVVAAIVVAFVYWLVVINAPVVEDYYY